MNISNVLPSDIMLLANTLVYDNKLKCANESTARSFLKTNKTDKNNDLSFMRRYVTV